MGKRLNETIKYIGLYFYENEGIYYYMGLSPPPQLFMYLSMQQYEVCLKALTEILVIL